MKKFFAFSVAVATLLLLLPLTVLGQPSAPTTATNVIKREEITPQKSFKLLRSETGKVEEISFEDYIFGVLAAEMPASYEIEALKAQAVAAHTFALHRKVTNRNREYDITDDFTLDQAFITEEKAREKWGDNAEKYVEKLKNAVSAAKNLAITYNGEIALSVYHAISFGKTEDCKNVWGGNYPYLVSVASVGDKLSPNYKSTKSVTLEEIKTAFKEFNLTDNPADYFKNITKTDAGAVKSVTLCGNKVSGSEIRKILDLRSNCFEVVYKDGSFKFTVYGYGHAVGMSQNGANYMAQQGADFKEILCHYYTGCKIEKLD